MTSLLKEDNASSAVMQVVQPGKVEQQWLEVWASGKTNEELRNAQLANPNFPVEKTPRYADPRRNFS